MVRAIAIVHHVVCKKSAKVIGVSWHMCGGLEYWSSLEWSMRHEHLLAQLQKTTNDILDHLVHVLFEQSGAQENVQHVLFCDFAS